MSERSALRNWTEYAIARTVVEAARWFPPVAEIAAEALDAFVPRFRRIAMRNLERAMPELDAAARARLVDGVFVSIGRALGTFARFPDLTRNNIGELIRYDGYEHFEEALARGKGALFATAHLGNWELSAFAHALLSRPMHVVVRPLDNPLLDAFVEKRRSLSGNRIIGKGDYARAILTALKRNEAVGILVDQNELSPHALFPLFFGIPAATAASFAKLAARSGAAVIPGFAFWSPAERKHVLKFYPLLELTGDAARDTQLVQSAVERAIREAPDQWLWIHRRWKTRPPGEADFYAV